MNLLSALIAALCLVALAFCAAAVAGVGLMVFALAAFARRVWCVGSIHSSANTSKGQHDHA